MLATKQIITRREQPLTTDGEYRQTDKQEHLRLNKALSKIITCVLVHIIMPSSVVMQEWTTCFFCIFFNICNRNPYCGGHSISISLLNYLCRFLYYLLLNYSLVGDEAIFAFCECEKDWSSVTWQARAWFPDAFSADHCLMASIQHQYKYRLECCQCTVVTAINLK